MNSGHAIQNFAWGNISPRSFTLGQALHCLPQASYFLICAGDTKDAAGIKSIILKAIHIFYISDKDCTFIFQEVNS